MSNDVIQGDKLNYLLVEGPDDAQVLFHLLRQYGLHSQITIQSREGIDTLLERLEVDLMRSAETRLGIIVDADIDSATRWQSLRDRLTRAGYTTAPFDPDPAGTIVTQAGRPLVGLWLMPDNAIPGMLEDFMSLLIPAKDVLWPMAQAFVQQVIATERRFPATQQMKANVHTWLAWQEEPGKPMGLAVTKHYFLPDAPHAQQLIEWVRRLFDI